MVFVKRNLHKMSSEPEQPVKKKPKCLDSDHDETDFINNLNGNGVQSLQLSLNEVELEFKANNCESLTSCSANSTDNDETPISPSPNIFGTENDSTLNDFQQNLIKQCLCTINETVLCDGDNFILLEWSDIKILEFLSNLQLLFDVYLKQNNNGFICSKIVTNCNLIIFNQYNLIEQIISLCETRNKFIHYLVARVLGSFLIIAKTEINNEWIETILSYLTTENLNYVKFNFSLEIIKRVVEWKDVEIHVLEENNEQLDEENCVKVSYDDSESFDTSSIKLLIIKSLEAKWPDLISKIQNLITNNSTVEIQTSVLTFLTLWKRIISVKANFSVIHIKPFYAHLEIFVGMLDSNLSGIIWKQLLSLFNEVLCYGSTLALQDEVPDDTRQLANLIVRYVKDNNLLGSLPYRYPIIVNSFTGRNCETAASSNNTINIDKTLLQKMVLLILKSLAVSVKETRSDSSDSSVVSDDHEFDEDMRKIERFIRQVLQKVDHFLKNVLEFHPETAFCKIIVHLFNDQDNYLIESLLCTLDIFKAISYKNARYPDLGIMLNPIHSFIEFLKIVSHDSTVLLDFLIGNETCFLLYLLRFLKFTQKNWFKFVSSCIDGNMSRNNNELQDTMTVLISLNDKINEIVSKGAFPYNISPITGLLTDCKNLYLDGNEFS